MRACSYICALLVAAIVLLAPQQIGQDRVPWQTGFKERYETAVYAKIDIHVYKLGSTSRTITSLFWYLNRAGIADERYYFVRCAVKDPLILSMRKPEEMAVLEKIRFVRTGDALYERFDAYYKEQCWAEIYFQYKSITEWMNR